MRPNRRVPSGMRAVAAALLLLGQVGMAADDVKDAPQDKQMAAVIAAVRAQEANYRDVEYVVKITTRTADQVSPNRAPQLASLETRHVVLQGDQILFHKQEHERVLAKKAATEELSAYDGEQTRTVVAGNCVNIHLGRFKHPDVHPAHSLPLTAYLVHFPLSVYLGGTKAIDADPKHPRFEIISGGVYDFTRVVPRLEGEEMVDGLRCVKVGVERWLEDATEPAVQHLWLAADRNYFCVKERLLPYKSTPGGLPSREMQVDELRELAAGLWFPMKLAVVNYDRQALKQKKRVVASRIEMIVEKANLSPRHDNVFFREVPIPADLPVFAIKDRALVGSTLPEPKGGDVEKLKLAEVVAKVAEQEKRYSDLEVKARLTGASLKPWIREENVTANASYEEHSLLRGSSAYFTTRNTGTTLGGQRSERFEVWVSDGQWTRSLDQLKQDGADVQIGASLFKVGMDKAESSPYRVPVYRSHMLLKRYARSYGPLAELLVSSRREEDNSYRLRVHYCGEALVDDHPCISPRPSFPKARCGWAANLSRGRRYGERSSSSTSGPSGASRAAPSSRS
jgi:hypothetical protein